MVWNKKLIARGESETITVGEKLGKVLKSSDIVLLTGELGAGKTTFVKGIAMGMGISDAVKSPTFTLAREYGTPTLKLYHLDLYRIEVKDFNVIEDYFDGTGIVAVEWGEGILPYISSSYVKVGLFYLDMTVRMIEIMVCCNGDDCELLRRVKVAFER